jgi:hypothetical protein
MGPLVRFSFLNFFDEIINKVSKKNNNNETRDEDEMEYWSNEINKALISSRQIFCDGIRNFFYFFIIIIFTNNLSIIFYIRL